MNDPEDGMYLAKCEAEGAAMLTEREPFPCDERVITDEDAERVLDDALALTESQWCYALTLAVARGMVTRPPRQRVTKDALGNVRVSVPLFSEMAYDALQYAMRTNRDASAVEALLKEAMAWKGGAK